VKRLSDLREFRLLREVVLPHLGSGSLTAPLGDDCAYLPAPKDAALLVVTSDAAPRPLVWSLGCESYWSWGWYAVAINASDLAAAGAKPLFFTSSVEAPDDMAVDAFEQFFKGMAAACAHFSLTNAGGNIRAAPRFACHAMAVGTESRAVPLTRSNCQPGDVIVAVGECGRFISAFLKAKRNSPGSLSKDEWRRLIKPEPRLRDMALLHQAGLVRAASDNSDGLLGALWNIAERSECGIELCLDGIDLGDEVREAAREAELDPWNLFFFWGDWQVVSAVPRGKLRTFRELANAEGVEYTVLGRAVDGTAALYGAQGGERRSMRVLRSENFGRDSFAGDLASHFDFMLRSSIFI